MSVSGVNRPRGILRYNKNRRTPIELFSPIFFPFFFTSHIIVGKVFGHMERSTDGGLIAYSQACGNMLLLSE